MSNKELGVYNSDYNASWQYKANQAILNNDEALLQAIGNLIFIDTDEIYYGDGRELGLNSQLFQFIGEMTDELPKREISMRLKKMDSRINMDISASKITVVGDDFQMDLVFEIQGRLLKLSRRVKGEYS